MVFFSVAVLKEDPEDLTHLAPTAGDVCVPLDETPIDYVLPDMLDEMILLSDPNLLSSGSNTRGSPQPLSVSTSSSSPDSFFSCKDELEPSSRPHSPILTQVINIFNCLYLTSLGAENKLCEQNGWSIDDFQ